MKNSSRQLLLEILLVKERYSAEDIRAVCDHLNGSNLREDFSEITNLINSLKIAQNGKRARASEENVDPVDVRERLLATIHRPESASVNKNLLSIARKLKIVGVGAKITADRSWLIERIESALGKMGDDDLKTVFRVRREKVAADEGYIGLANYIIHKDG